MNPVRSSTAVLFLTSIFVAGATHADDKTRPPNIVLIVADDLGYRDLGCYDAIDFKTPNIDKIASEGIRLTSFYTTASIGSPSRASLLTGRYPVRMKFEENLGPQSGKGLNLSELTIAESLKTKNYATACFGKWALGEAPRYLPTKQGFDEYFGVPYSNDLGWWQGQPEDYNSEHPPIPLIDAESTIEENPDQRFLTKRYTDQSVRFIREHKDEPFFLYLAHAMPHTPLFVSENFSGSAEYGLFGDVMQELDWSVGEILKILKETGNDNRTLVIFTSDNGPALDQGSHGGKADPLRDGKYTRYEGGHRVPCVIRFPKMFLKGKELPGTVSLLDFFPTINNLASVEKLPDDLKIDGIDMTDYFSGKTAKSPRSTFFYSQWAVRHGDWKLLLPGGYREVFPKPANTYKPGHVKYEHLRLFNLSTDPGETNSQHEDEDHAELITNLKKLCYDFQAEFKPPTPETESDKSKKK